MNLKKGKRLGPLAGRNRRPIPKPQPLLPSVPRCGYCGDSHHRDLACSFCSQIRSARYAIEQSHPGRGLQHQNLVKLAGHLASGMHEGFIRAHGRGNFDPTRQELDQAAKWALEQFLETGYVLRETPNGSMTTVGESTAPQAGKGVIR
jgi:hypothetical protein